MSVMTITFTHCMFNNLSMRNDWLNGLRNPYCAQNSAQILVSVSDIGNVVMRWDMCMTGWKTGAFSAQVFAIA